MNPRMWLLPGVLALGVGAAPAAAQSFNPTDARSPLDPPTVVSPGASGTRPTDHDGRWQRTSQLWGGYWGGGPWFYVPSLYVVPGFGYNYGPWGAVWWSSPYPVTALNPPVLQPARAVPPFFSRPLNKVQDNRPTRVVSPGDDFYLAPSGTRSGAPSRPDADALGGRLRVERAEGELYLVEWQGPARGVEWVEFRALGAEERVLAEKRLSAAPFRGLLRVPEGTRAVELEVRNKEGVTASLKLPVERFRELDAARAPAKNAPEK